LSISKDHIALDVLNTKSDGTKTTTTTNNNNNDNAGTVDAFIERTGSATSGVSLSPQNELTSLSLENIAETLKTG